MPVSLWDIYSAFANCKGGGIILGVKENEDGSWCTTGLKDERKLLKDFWDTINNVTKVSQCILTEDDIETYQTGNNIKAELLCEKNNHPDRVLAHLKLKNEKDIKLMGVRMQVSGLSHDEKCLQLEAFKWESENSIPDIIIGDFNWDSTIYKTNKEDEFNDVFLTKCRNTKKGRRSSWKNKYNIWPDEVGDFVSFISKNGTKSGTPDRVMWRENINVVRHEYYNKIVAGACFPDGWLSDHDILIFEVSIE